MLIWVPMKLLTPAETIDLLIAKAKELRSAGVLRLSIDGFSVELAHWDPPVDETESGKRFPQGLTEDPDPMNDPTTFGRKSVPGFERPVDDDLGGYES